MKRRGNDREKKSGGVARRATRGEEKRENDIQCLHTFLTKHPEFG